MNPKKVRRILVFILIDAGIAVASAIMPFVFRFGIFSIHRNPLFLNTELTYLPVDIIILILVNALLHLYNRVWTYASIGELYDCIKSAAITEAIYIAYKMLLGVSMFRSYYPFNFMILLLLLCGSRISVRILRGVMRSRHKKGDVYNVMIIGGGAAASLLIKDYQLSSKKIKIACIIDDNPAKKGKRLADIPIIGGRDEIIRAADKYGIDEIVIAIPSAPPAEVREIISICQQTKARVRILPAIASTLSDSLSSTVRDVNYEDLLGRDSVVIRNPELHDFISDKVIMVTGGGGSIGSELCRQIAANKPKKLVIVDIYENTTYELEMELRRYYPEVDIEILIASVRDYDRLDTIFSKYRPDVV